MLIASSHSSMMGDSRDSRSKGPLSKTTSSARAEIFGPSNTHRSLPMPEATLALMLSGARLRQMFLMFSVGENTEARLISQLRLKLIMTFLWNKMHD